MLRRRLKINLPKKQSAFLFGPRKTGKSTLLKHEFPESVRFDLLNSETYYRYLQYPHYFREDVLALPKNKFKHPIIIDEVQMVPRLLDEVHWLIENSEAYFILCGSSARKLRRPGVNLLGGRAWTYKLHPLCFAELKDFDLLKIFSRGLIPSHFQSEDYQKSLKSYIESYLNEEIKAESLVRNLPAFAKFLDSLAFSNGEPIVYSNIARDCAVSAKTVKEYFQIMVDTLVGIQIEPFVPEAGRDSVSLSPKFYLFDIGLANQICKRTIGSLKGEEAGKALENYILMELIAYKDYQEKDYDIKFWRDRYGRNEVDFILSSLKKVLVAIEVKISNNIEKKDILGLINFKKQNPQVRAIVVCLESRKRKTLTMDIEIIPVKNFLEELWTGAIVPNVIH